MYLYGAVRSIGAKSERTVSTLRARFVALEREPDVRPKENDYTAADERIEVASALLNLDDSPARKNQYLDFVLKWLKPAPQDLTGAKLDDFWEHRWIAVTVVENTGTPREAKSFLEAMLKEPHRRGWVYPKVSRALDALKDADHSTTDKPSKRE